MELNMERYLVKLIGSTPLIMHNSTGADPMNEYVKAMKPIKNKRTNKSDQDIADLSELQFLSSLYWSEELDGLYMPSECLSAMLFASAKSSDKKNGRKQFAHVNFSHFLGYKLEIPNRSSKKALVADESLRYTRMVVVSRSRVSSTRSIFTSWSLDVEIEIDSCELNSDIVHEWLIYGGKYKGLCARRPGGPTPGKFGMFYVDEFKKMDLV